MASCGVFAFTYPPCASLGKLNLFILLIFTPGIKFIIPIAPFISFIALFIVFSISPITPLIPDFTESEIAFPIFIPKLENAFFTLSHIPLKKLPILLNILVIPLYAS